MRKWSRTLVEQDRARCNIVWVAPFCSGDKKRLGWHRLKSLCVWLSGTTKYKTSTANRAGAKTEHPLWTHNWKEKTEEKKEKKEHRTTLSADTEANYHSHCTRRHKLDWLALSGGVDSKTEQSVTKKTHCSVARRQEEANDMQIDWMFVLAGKSNQWHFCLLAPARGASTSDSSCAADRPGISTLESGRGETFSDIHYEAISLIYHHHGCIN